MWSPPIRAREYDAARPQKGQNMKKTVTINGTTTTLEASEYMATIYDGHSHIERRVFVDGMGLAYVRINGFFAWVYDLRRVNRFDVDIWFDGGKH